MIVLSVSAQTINITIHFYDFGLGNGFLDMTPKAQETKERNKLDCIRILNFSILL